MAIGLYDDQLQAIMHMHNGCILCGEVGSGKSRTAIGYYFKENGGGLVGDYYPMSDPPQDLYIITTAKKRDSMEWEDDMVPFLISSSKENDIYKHVVVVDSWNNIKKYVGIKGAFFIFDEQRVVGSGTWVKSFLKIASNNKWILLSATPGDTWKDYIPVFVANGFYRDRTDFCSQHVVWDPYKSYPEVQRYLNEGKLIRLRNETLVQLKVKKNTVPIINNEVCDYDIKEYKDLMKNRWDKVNNEPIDNSTKLFYELRKIVNSSEDRQEKVLEIFEKHPKLIIFYNYDYELEILEKIFSCYQGITIAEWNGHTHQPVPSGGSWVYLVQYFAGSEAWNCVTTDTIVFYSQTYSYRTLKQAAGRIDRRNTPYTYLYYYHLQSKSPIDIGISRAIKQKKNFNEAAFIRKMEEKQ